MKNEMISGNLGLQPQQYIYGKVLTYLLSFFCHSLKFNFLIFIYGSKYRLLLFFLSQTVLNYYGCKNPTAKYWICYILNSQSERELNELDRTIR